MIIKGACWKSIAPAFRRTAVPLAAYYAVTLALPLANGAARSGAFRRHALVVLAVPPIVIGLVCVVQGIVRAGRRACRYGASRRWNDFGRVSDS